METTRSLQKLAGWGGRVFFGNRDVSERVDGMVPYFFPFKAMQEYGLCASLSAQSLLLLLWI